MRLSSVSPASTAAFSAVATGTMSMPCSALGDDRLARRRRDAGLSAMRSLKPVASDASSTAPMIAVPSDEPRFWAVP